MHALLAEATESSTSWPDVVMGVAFMAMVAFILWAVLR